MILITPLTLIYYYTQPTVTGTTPSTVAALERFDGVSGFVRQTSRTPYGLDYTRNAHERLKRKFKQEEIDALIAIEAEKTRREALTRLQRVDEDIASVDAELATPKLSREYIAADERRAELTKERVVAEREQKIRDLADEIIARRKARLR